MNVSFGGQVLPLFVLVVSCGGDAGPAEWRGIHPDDIGVCCVPSCPAEAPPLHGVWQEAALHRGVPM